MYFKGIFHKALFILLILSCVVVLSFAQKQKEDDFDRLDGMGTSGKRVDVIEWQDNLEIHVYPAGSLAGLGLKMVKEGGKKIMVISYRFNNMESTPLIRRAVLGIPLTDKFQAFKDTSAQKQGYDKVIISNASLESSKILAYKLEAEPTQLYPDGHPMLAEKEEEQDKSKASNKSVSQERTPANETQESEGVLESAPPQSPNGVRSFSW